MRIKLLSDLHHEFQPGSQSQEYFQYTGEDVLVLAGDIASGSTNTMDVIKKFKNAGYEHIVYVPGNHEYYGTDIRDFDAKMMLKCDRIPGVHFLNPGHIIINDVVFIGATLWTDFQHNFSAKHSAEAFIADFRLIKHFSPEHSVMLYDKHITYIKAVSRMFPDKKKVIVTHFLPTKECISERFRGPNLLNNYFANDLTDFVSTLSDTTWLFGHTHDSVDIMVWDTRLVCNPYGYFNRETNHDFDPRKTICI